MVRDVFKTAPNFFFSPVWKMLPRCLGFGCHHHTCTLRGETPSRDERRPHLRHHRRSRSLPSQQSGSHQNSAVKTMMTASGMSALFYPEAVGAALFGGGRRPSRSSSRRRRADSSRASSGWPSSRTSSRCSSPFSVCSALVEGSSILDSLSHWESTSLSSWHRAGSYCSWEGDDLVRSLSRRSSRSTGRVIEHRSALSRSAPSPQDHQQRRRRGTPQRDHTRGIQRRSPSLYSARQCLRNPATANAARPCRRSPSPFSPDGTTPFRKRERDDSRAERSERDDRSRRTSHERDEFVDCCGRDVVTPPSPGAPVPERHFTDREASTPLRRRERNYDFRRTSLRERSTKQSTSFFAERRAPRRATPVEQHKSSPGARTSPVRRLYHGPPTPAQQESPEILHPRRDARRLSFEPQPRRTAIPAISSRVGTAGKGSSNVPSAGPRPPSGRLLRTEDTVSSVRRRRAEEPFHLFYPEASSSSESSVHRDTPETRSKDPKKSSCHAENNKQLVFGFVRIQDHLRNDAANG